MQQAPLVAPRHTASLHRAWSMHRLQDPLGAIVNACCALSRAGKGPGRAGQAPATCLPAPPHHACAALYISSGEGLLHVATHAHFFACCMHAMCHLDIRAGLLHVCTHLRALHAACMPCKAAAHALMHACNAWCMQGCGGLRGRQGRGQRPCTPGPRQGAQGSSAGTYSKATGQWRETAVQCVLHCGVGACAPHAITISSCAQTLILIASV